MSNSTNKFKENEIRKSLIDSFKKWRLLQKLEKSLPFLASVEVREKVRIPYQVWVEPRTGSERSEFNPALQIRHYEQDIAFFIKSNIDNQGNSDLSFFNTREEFLNLPLLIVEVKRGVSTHDLITYSEKAKAIRNIFPYSKYLFVAGADRTRKWNLQGTAFDAIHGLSSLTDKSQWKKKELRKKLDNLIGKIEQDLISFESSGIVSDRITPSITDHRIFNIASETIIIGKEISLERQIASFPTGNLRNFIDYLVREIYKAENYEKVDLQPKTRISFYTGRKVKLSIWNSANNHLKDEAGRMVLPRKIEEQPVSKKTKVMLKKNISSKLSGINKKDILFRPKEDRTTFAMKLYPDRDYVLDEFLKFILNE